MNLPNVKPPIAGKLLYKNLFLDKGGLGSDLSMKPTYFPNFFVSIPPEVARTHGSSLGADAIIRVICCPAEVFNSIKYPAGQLIRRRRQENAPAVLRLVRSIIHYYFTIHYNITNTQR